MDKTIVLIGQPNVGKSTLFNILSDIRNKEYGSTYEIKSTHINIAGQSYRLIDLPGVYSLNPSQPSEEITLKYLMHNKVDLVINVVDPSLLARSLELTVELCELQIPMIIALNKQDEAKHLGIKVDVLELSKQTGITVVETEALYGKGIKHLADTCHNEIIKGVRCPNNFKYTHHLEVLIENLSENIETDGNSLNGAARFYAIKLIENPDKLPRELNGKYENKRNNITREIFDQHKLDSSEAISYERHHLAMKMSEKITSFEPRQTSASEKFDRFLLHPIWGNIALLVYFFLYFFTIFQVGSFLGGLVEYPIEQLGMTFAPLKESQPFLWHTINGAYMGFAGVVGLILPYFLPLVFLTSLFEDTGYIQRIAFLVDGLMHKIGLHGKSVAPFILGFGCSVPAIYATRMIENKRDRIITSILIPFVPCSARIAVVFALTAAFTGPAWAFIVFAYVLLIIAINGKVLSKLYTKPIGLILEIPRLKAPSLSMSFHRTWFKIKDFIKDAFTFLIMGSIVLGWIEYFQVADYIDSALAFLLEGALGLPEQLGSTLLFGFFRKELILVMANQAMGVTALSQLPLTNEQVIVFIIFVTFYFPCFTTFVVLWKEFGIKVVSFSAILSLAVALISAVLFKIILAM